MKAFIYMAFIVAFIVIFQQNPLIGVILIAIVGGGYFYFKSRKNGRGTRMLHGGRMPIVQDQSQTLLTYLLLQQLSSNNNENMFFNSIERNISPEEPINEHQKARDELLELLK